MSQNGYVPSVSDILRSYQRTTGICVSHFKANEKSYNFYDVGGAQSERKKWIKAFPDTNFIIYTFDAACFGEPLRENESSDAMQEQFSLWQGISNMSIFRKTNIIVFFTKVDKLAALLAQSPPFDRFGNAFEEVPTTAEDALRGLSNHLVSLVTNQDGRERPPRWLTFWHASIVNSSTEVAEVVLSALELSEELAMRQDISRLT